MSGATILFPPYVDPDLFWTPDIDEPVLGSIATQPIQGDLPEITKTLWRAIALRFPELDHLGAWGDAAHAARRSDHNRLTMNGNRGPRAIDCMTMNAALQSRVVQWAILPEIRGPYGLNWVINQKKKWTPGTGWKPARYQGISPHIDHVHISCDVAPTGVPPVIAPTFPAKTIWRDPVTGDAWQPFAADAGLHLSPGQYNELIKKGWKVVSHQRPGKVIG